MFKGSMPALITPFKNGKVDVDALKHLVDWHVAEGSHGLVPVGTTGESPTLSHSEHEEVIRVVVVILHELAHAYHDQVLGFGEETIIASYDAAMKKGILERVKLFTGRTVRHYGATNHKEYFAEATEAYLYRNDFYPFVAAELKEHDQKAFAVMKKIWGPAAVQ